MITSTLGLLLAGMGLLIGCGETCQSTCDHVYDKSECGITRAGTQVDDLIDDCVNDCLNAMASPGGMGDYDPHVNRNDQENVPWETDAQAAAWIDCVWEYAPEPGPQPSCDNIDPNQGGLCQPI